MKKVIVLIELFVVICMGVSGYGGGIGPYLPEVKFRDYVPTTITPGQIKVALPDGKILEPSRYTTVKSLNGEWRFSGLVNAERPFGVDCDLDQGWDRGDFNDSSWGKIAVPLNWYVKYPDARQKNKPYVKGWYRHSFKLDGTELTGRRVLLHFGVIGYDARLFVNGREAGTHHGDFTPWEVDITELVKAGENTIALRVFSDFGAVHGTLKAASHVYGAQWSIGSIKGGLWQDVSLLLETPVRVQRMLINPKLADSAIEVDYRIDNNTGKTVSFELGGVVSSAMKTEPDRVNAVAVPAAVTLKPGVNQGTLTVKLKQPEKWSTDHPYLYYLTLYLKDGDRFVTAAAARFGFREFLAKGKFFYLNGDRIYLYGENFPSSRYEGKGETPEQATATLAAQLTGYKSLGYNIVRTAHSPTSPMFYRIADEIGMMVYDEWGWSFNKVIDEEAFERNNLAEITEWVYRDYNHPCVVMWSCGNEVVFKESAAVKRQLNKEVDLVKSLDRTGRPVSVFSGAGLWSHYGSDRMHTDVIDQHHYIGLCFPAWTCLKEELGRYYRTTAETYADNGKFDKPYIVWECVGFSWGSLSDANFKPNDILRYAAYAERKTGWGDPNGIGFAGTIGLAAGLDPKRGLDYGKEIYGRRILEQLRQNPDIQGFAPWFHGNRLKMAVLWTQPILSGLRDENFIPLRNIFSGKEYRQTLYVVNHTGKELRDAVAEIFLVLQDGRTVPLKTLPLPAIKSWQIFNTEVLLAVPTYPGVKRGQLRVAVKTGGKIVSRNFYDIFMQSPDILNTSIKAVRKIAVLDTGDASDVTAVVNIMQQLGLQSQVITVQHKLDGYGLLVVPAALHGTRPPVYPGATAGWVNRGGILLQLEQHAGNCPLLPNQALTQAPSTFVDLAVPAHPAFKDLDQSNFDTWNNPDCGFVIKNSISPFSLNALAVQGPFLGRRNVGNAVMEGFSGQGRIFCSQLEATALWGKDSAASTYLRNLFAYLTDGRPAYSGVMPLSGRRSNQISCVKENLVPIDLKAYANRGFADEADNDGKGGWTDQGNNDFRMMPLGRQTAAGVEFDIIDPKANHDKSCLVLRGNARPDFPATINGIKIGQKFSRLFFLHACAWGKGQEAGCYRIRYADGSAVDYPLEEGRNIGDWWNCARLPEAEIGFLRKNKFDHEVGLYVMPWDNPYPEKAIAAIDFLSSGSENRNRIDFIESKGAVPILVALTGEKAHPAPVKVAADGKWSAIGWKGGDKPQVTALSDGIKVLMPAPRNGGLAVLMGKFPTGRFKDGGYNYLSFMIKTETDGALELILPEKKWAASRSFIVTLGRENRQWTRVRINLKKDMTGKLFSADQLRGELFIYNGLQSRPAQPGNPAVFYLKDVKFE